MESSRTLKQVYPITVKITVTNAGVVSFEKKSTDKDYQRVVGLAITYDDTANLAGSLLNMKLGGKSVWKQPMVTALLTSDSSCPVNDRYYNYIDEKVDNSLIEFDYTPGAAFPAGDTVITATLQCSKSTSHE